jgi:GNAT superfamily N-acetyltransferase
MIIRTAVNSDLPALVEMGDAMLAESRNSFPDIEPDRVAKQIGMAHDFPSMVLFSVAEINDRLVGFVTGFAGDYTWSTKRRAACDLLFLRDESRSVAKALALLDHYKTWAKEQGALKAMAGNMTGMEPELMGRLFEMAGFTRMGATYQMEIG